MISKRISDDISPQMKMVILILMHFCSFVSIQNVEKPHAIQRNVADIINDDKLFPAVYPRINWRKFLTLSNQTSRYICKCIRMASTANKVNL